MSRSYFCRNLASRLVAKQSGLNAFLWKLAKRGRNADETRMSVNLACTRNHNDLCILCTFRNTLGTCISKAEELRARRTERDPLNWEGKKWTWPRNEGCGMRDREGDQGIWREVQRGEAERGQGREREMEDDNWQSTMREWRRGGRSLPKLASKHRLHEFSVFVVACVVQ